MQGVVILLETLQAENKGFENDVAARAWLAKIEKYRQFIEHFLELFERPTADFHRCGAASMRKMSECHAAGVGKPLNPERTRRLLALRINVLAKGHSGISLGVLQQYIDAFNGENIQFNYAQIFNISPLF